MTATADRTTDLRDAMTAMATYPTWFAEGASAGQWVAAPHLDLIASALVRAIVGEGKRRLVIQMPPRHGKSALASEYFPAWYVGRYQQRRVILASYEHDFAASWGLKAMRLVDTWGKRLWGQGSVLDQQRGDDWTVRAGGGMVCAGVGGAITGRGADLLVIDDPVKNAEEANSETYRERAWDWYRSTAYTRLEPVGIIVLIQTRWHEDDLAGRILADERGDWEVLSLPAIAESGDALGRPEGEALWPSRYPVDALDGIRASIGNYWWQALYQQRPAPPEGALFKSHWWHYWQEPPRDLDSCLLSVDCAFKDTDSSDFVVVQCWGHKGASIYLLDQWRDRADFSRTVQAVQEMAEQWPAATLKLIEDAANGPAVINALYQRVRGIVPVKPQGGKLSRAQAILPLVEAGNVYLPEPSVRPWVREFLTEAQSFPLGSHDDQVDAMTQALQRFQGARDPVVKAKDPRPRYVKDIEKQMSRMQHGYGDGAPMVRPSEWRR